MSRILTILPKGEGFSPSRFGAIALCVRDFTLFSRFRQDTLIVGGIPSEGYAGLNYMTPPKARWYENRTRAYARGCVNLMSRMRTQLAEIHNRPHIFRLIAGKTSAKLALHLHNDPQEMEDTRTPAERMRLLERASAVFCVSEFIRRRFLEGLPEHAERKLHVIYNGIAIPETIPEKENRIVFAGRMTEGKGALLLARALRIALPKLDGWRAVFIGSRRHEAGNPATPHEKEIADMLARLGGQIELPGFLPHEETLRHFARAGIAVVPSVWDEPFGRTALEAMAYGCAVVSSGRGALREVTADAALTPPELTAEALAHAIQLLAEDAELRASYARLGRERAQYFAIAGRAEALDRVRENIMMKDQNV